MTTNDNEETVATSDSVNKSEVIPAAPLGKDEMNFAEFPITLLTDRVPKGQNILKFEDEIYDAKRKRVITRKRVIEGSKEYGLPTATDDTVILALIQLTKLMSDFSRRDVEFSRHELIKILGWANEGKSYARIKLSLQRIANVTYNYDNAWWDAKHQTWTTKIFHILETVEINDTRLTDDRGDFDLTRIVWNEVVFQSFQSGFLRNIDFQLCMNLERPTALRMYRFLGKRFYVNPDLTFDLKEFAFEHVGIHGNYEGGAQIARMLQPAIDELEAVGFLEPLKEHERFLKSGRSWEIRLIQKKNLAVPQAVEIVPSNTDGPEVGRSDLIAEFVRRGVTKKKAERLVSEYPPRLLRTKLEILDWLVETKDKRVAVNPSGWLVESIQENYAVPKGFVAKADRLRLAEEAAKEAQVRVESHRLKKQDEARDRSELKAIDHYWNSLTPVQQAELDAMLEAQADPKVLANEIGPLKRIGQSIRRNEYMRQLIRSRRPTLFDV